MSELNYQQYSNFEVSGLFNEIISLSYHSPYQHCVHKIMTNALLTPNFVAPVAISMLSHLTLIDLLLLCVHFYTIVVYYLYLKSFITN